MRERQFNDLAPVHEQASRKEVVLDLLARLVAEEQLDQAMESGPQRHAKRSRSDLPWHVKRATTANPGLDLVQRPSRQSWISSLPSAVWRFLVPP